MADASRKQMGPGAQGKGAGVGALTDMPANTLPENKVLSNRDKKVHPRERGFDSKAVETEQLEEHDDNRQRDE
jgi:hypothetical protein